MITMKVSVSLWFMTWINMILIAIAYLLTIFGLFALIALGLTAVAVLSPIIGIWMLGIYSFGKFSDWRDRRRFSRDRMKMEHS